MAHIGADRFQRIYPLRGKILELILSAVLCLPQHPGKGLWRPGSKAPYFRREAATCFSHTESSEGERSCTPCVWDPESPPGLVLRRRFLLLLPHPAPVRNQLPTVLCGERSCRTREVSSSPCLIWHSARVALTVPQFSRWVEGARGQGRS